MPILRTFAARFSVITWGVTISGVSTSLAAIDPVPPLVLTDCAQEPAARLVAVVAPPAPAAPPAARLTKVQLLDLAARDPEAIAKLGIERYERDVRDYGCVFVKREFINGKLRDEEEIDVRFRNQPQSVFMFWKRGSDQVKRALYVDSAKFRDGKGQKIAKIEPAGAVIRLVVSEVEMPIHGKEARDASRRTIDEFGFRSTFAILERFNNVASKNGVLNYKYEGEGEIDGRPTFTFVRLLPYTGENGIYPDAKMVLHLDQEWLLPTGVYSYADREGKKLLGSYTYRNVRLNPGFSDQDFQF